MKEGRSGLRTLGGASFPPGLIAPGRYADVQPPPRRPAGVLPCYDTQSSRDQHDPLRPASFERARLAGRLRAPRRGRGRGYYYWTTHSPRTQPQAQRGRFGGGPNQVVPVRVVPVQKGTIDVEVRALGTVTPLQTVTVRSRLDGELVRVLFTEGQHVRAGQVLAEVDARPYEVQLAQCTGSARGEPGAARECQERPRALREARGAKGSSPGSRSRRRKPSCSSTRARCRPTSPR